MYMPLKGEEYSSGYIHIKNAFINTPFKRQFLCIIVPQVASLWLLSVEVSWLYLVAFVAEQYFGL